MDMNTSASIVANLGLQIVMFMTAKNMFLGSGSYFGFCNRDLYTLGSVKLNTALILQVQHLTENLLARESRQRFSMMLVICRMKYQ